jgi:hypothetical protein
LIQAEYAAMLQLTNEEIQSLMWQALPVNLHAYLLRAFCFLPMEQQEKLLGEETLGFSWVADQLRQLDVSRGNGAEVTLRDCRIPDIRQNHAARVLFQKEKNAEKRTVDRQANRLKKEPTDKQDSVKGASKSGKSKESSKSGAPATKRAKTEIVCFNCNTVGHAAAKCSQPCKFCASTAENHSAFYCTQNPKATDPSVKRKAQATKGQGHSE